MGSESRALFSLLTSYLTPSHPLLTFYRTAILALFPNLLVSLPTFSMSSLKISQTTPMPVFCWTDKTLKSMKSKTRSFRKTLGPRQHRKKARRRRNESAKECRRGFDDKFSCMGLLKVHCCSIDELLKYKILLSIYED